MANKDLKFLVQLPAESRKIKKEGMTDGRSKTVGALFGKVSVLRVQNCSKLSR